MYTYIIYRYTDDVKVFLSEKYEMDYTGRHENTPKTQTLHRAPKPSPSLLSLPPMTDGIPTLG